MSATATSPVEGRKVVVTGKIDGESRVSAEAKLRAAGAHVQSSVTRDTDILVTGANVGQTKINAATKNGTQVISWVELWGGEGPAATPPPPTAKRAVQIAPMLAKAGDDEIPGDGYVYEIKWDGYRGIAHIDGAGGVTICSRNGNDLTERFAQVAAELADLPACILDGELVCLDDQGRSDFEALGTGTTRFMVFDVLEAAGHDARTLPLEARQEVVKELLTKVAGVLVTQSPRFDDGQTLLDHARAHGLEGIIAKRRGSRYQEDSRTGAWLKIKLRCEQEFVVIGWTPGKGALAGSYGTLLLAVTNDAGDLEYVGHSGGGGTATEGDALFAQLRKIEVAERWPTVVLGELSAKDRREIRDVTWVEPVLVAQVAFQRWTADGRLWHPTLKGIRNDKSPADVRREAVGPS